MKRPGVEVRLEQRQEPAAVADRGKVGSELGRVVGVAVEEAHTRGLASRLEPPPCAAKLEQSRRGVCTRYAGELERRERSCGVLPVVLAGNREGEIQRL